MKKPVETAFPRGTPVTVVKRTSRTSRQGPRRSVSTVDSGLGHKWNFSIKTFWTNFIQKKIKAIF